MKASFYISACFILSFAGISGAQNLDNKALATADMSSTESESLFRGFPFVEKAQANEAELLVSYPAQEVATLEAGQEQVLETQSAVDVSVLQQPSAFRNVATGRSESASDEETSEIKKDLALISATYRIAGKRESNCQTIALSIEQRIKLDDSSLLEIVETEGRSNPSCACEIVKAAIKATDADPQLVVSILESVISAAPQTMMIASQCAIAAAPESLPSVQAMLSKYEANAGDSGYSSKSSKDAKDAKVANALMPNTVASIPNPLDFPGLGPIGPARGLQPALSPLPPIIVSSVTQVGP
jgi:hypothetical protein